MLEGLAAWVINNYLGKYVENLNTDQLSIALLQGAVELENLPLRKDALRHVGLPIEVRAGFIGKVKLKIPISQITSAPWEIFIEKLYVVAGPIRLTELDEEAEEQALVDYKLSLLDGIEACWRSETETAQDTSYYASSYSSWLGLSMSFATNIIENLQLKIKDVHMRFEDNVTVKDEIFAAGIKIDSLSAQSCDGSWLPKFVSYSSSSESFKLLEMTGFSMYWDKISAGDMCSDFALSQLAEAMCSSVKISHDYLLSPVSAQAKVKRNRSEQPLRSKHNPRIVCDLTLDHVPLTLMDWQYSQMVGCMKGLEWVERRRGHIRERPRNSVCKAPREWWLYAVKRVTPHRLSTWEACLSRARDNVAYVGIYSRLLASATASNPLTDQEKQAKERIEWELDFNQLKALREIAMRRVRPPNLARMANKPKAQEGLSILASWFPGWWGWQSEAPQASQLDDQILDALADTVENNTLLKRDMVFGHFNFTLKQGSLNLCQQSRVPLLELQFENVKLGYESRPRTGSHWFNLTLGALFLNDHISKDSAFPVLISPQRNETGPGFGGRNLPPGLAKLLGQSNLMNKDIPLFQLMYEYKPFNSPTDNRLVVHSKSLDVVYNPSIVKWIIDFFTTPYFDPALRRAARKGYHAMKMKTKKQFLDNWENILQGHLNNRKTWDLELDISAPQIFLVEHFNDKDAVLCVVDFGKLHFTNRHLRNNSIVVQASIETEEDSDDAFQTPCSTPPGSIAEDPPTVGSPKSSPTDTNFTENLLHDKLYDRYSLDFCDLQILVGRVRDNWKFAHLKGTSTLHVLDKFNISLQIERRVVYTIDPQFPSLTISGNLPKLVVHVNEQKVCALKTLMDVISGKGLISPLRSHETTPSDEIKFDDAIGTSHADADASDTSARLVMLQFCVDQMALEVQSRGRSVAELQVNGVKLSFTKRPYDTSLSLSVHGLLLVDALQNFGQDFELLLASHKHVGMDSIRGSLQDSEPTSPTSPASPEPEPRVPTSPMAISQALSSLELSERVKSPICVSPPQINVMSTELPDSEALITVELLFVSADCPTNSIHKEDLQVANIQFNNLDIIANQETIVELMGFVRRVFPKESSQVPPPMATSSVLTENLDGSRMDLDNSSDDTSTRTQLTFDFHRLNVLLLRAVIKEPGLIVGKKIATATMTEAKIHANIGKIIEVDGSLGGLQVLDLTPEGHLHQRIVSIGEDPLVNPPSHHSSRVHLLTCMAEEMYSMSRETRKPNKEVQAFSFSIKRTPVNHDTDVAEISIRMASVWYTHSPRFLYELKSCAAEFKQYLSNLARSISTAATEVAIGLMHARTESLAQSLSMGGRLYGSSSDISQTPRRFRSISYSSDFLEFSKGNNSPLDQISCVTLIKWDVVLASPVVVLPRNPSSPQVVVAHLGSISITNSEESPVSSPWGPPTSTIQKFSFQIKDINLYTVDITERLKSYADLNESSVLAAEKMYGCSVDGKPVLHDTSVQLTVVRQAGHVQNRNDQEILLDGGVQDGLAFDHQENIQVSGKVVTRLKLSLSRQQYEQLLETTDLLLAETEKAFGGDVSPPPRIQLADISEDAELHTGVSTLSLDPALRARMMLHQNLPLQDQVKSNDPIPPRALSVSFELPELTVELIADLGVGEQGLVDLSFKELIIQFDKSHKSEINIQVSLRSVTMEDLQKPLDSKYRWLMSSSNFSDTRSEQMPNFYSRSCPNIPVPSGETTNRWHSSLPDHLETEHVLGVRSSRHKHVLDVEKSLEKRRKGSDSKCPYTPPPSPRGNVSPPIFHEDNLVHVNVLIKPPAHSNMNSTRISTVDFNSLDVIVNVESWLVVLDFFGISDMEQELKDNSPYHEQPYQVQQMNKGEETDSQLEVSVRSLTLLLNRTEYEVGRAAMSQLKAKLVTTAKSGTTNTEASVGSFTLSDLTPVHSTLYRHRFITAGLKLNMKKYSSPNPNNIMAPDIELKLEMTSLVYVHTQRYVSELQAFFRLFPHLRKRIGYTKGNKVLEDDENTISTRILLELSAVSPIILVPMSSQSLSVLIADLGNLKVSNKLLMSGSPGTIGSSSDPAKDVLLDVMNIQLESMDILTGERKIDKGSAPNSEMISLVSYYVERKGTSLLREKCHLSVQVERNLMPLLHCVPDMSIHGTLSTLAANLTLTDYKLISGLLSFNIGETLDDISPQPEIISPYNPEIDVDIVWTCTSLRFELVDVNVQLMPTENSSLACINFIKSILLIETYSNRTQDIDLVSEEILITDIRFADQPANKRSNVFTNILQPINTTSDLETVQAQVHHRKRLDLSKFTILLNNMRLMAILDWWEAVQNFILTKPDYVPPVSNIVSSDSGLNKIDENIPFELKLNITDSEIVVVENTSQWDSNAVILKSTTVITYRPLEIDKPVSCNLNHCEMFSCILGMEEDTALSIIDPVTINMDILTRQDAEGVISKVLKIQMVHLSLRLSYHDVRMFSQMLISLPKQTQQARNQPLDKHPVNLRNQLEKLKALGFNSTDCLEALTVCEGKLDDAALWLTQHAAPLTQNHQDPSSPQHYQNNSAFSFNSVKVDTDSISLCLIDDCRDADVPLLEIALSNLALKHALDSLSGCCSGTLSGHYYNRLLSGWEPMLEPWRYSLCWDYSLSFALTKTRLELHVASADALNINLTSSLVELYKAVRDTWTEDYYNPKDSLILKEEGQETKIVASPPGYRRRSPFVPFALRNDTGSRIWYSTVIGTPDSMPGPKSPNSSSDSNLTWVFVEPGAVAPFSFNERGKLRHRDTHKLRTHQICIRVEGWKPVGPVTIDKVGVYFRQASPDYQAVDMDLAHTRVVLEVTLEGSARKLITVRSSLQICNLLKNTVEIKLDNQYLKKNRSLFLKIPSESTLSIPILYTTSQLWIRPLDVGPPSGRAHMFCTKPIDWGQVSTPNQVVLDSCQCRISNSSASYRFCVSVKRENYPPERSTSVLSSWLQPAHTITLLSPLTLVNLLPYELHCDVNKDMCKVRIKPGNQASIHEVDLEGRLELSLYLDNFPKGGTIEIPTTSSNFTGRVRLHDHSNRRLFLQVSANYDSSSALRISIIAPFWFINKTALPIVFKQEGVATETAGQYEEHEIARMVAPLLFSTTAFADSDSNPTVVARIGSAVHPEGVPQWCSSISLQPGVKMRRLKVCLRDNRPDLVYMIGVEIRHGRGRYRNTKIVTLSALYQIHNKSSFRLQFSQRCFASTISDPGAQATYLTTVPNCSLPFHWPRLDKDQLLCVRILDVPQCLWSGGFKIDDNNSFHLNIRDINGRMYFLRVEIVLQGATYFILTTDADTMPPPIRIDNYSLVSLQFHQVGLNNLSHTVKAQTLVPYAWDEPTQPPVLTVTAPGGVCANYDLEKLGEGPILTYENFIYIAFSGTFNNSKDGNSILLEGQELVLDVPDPNSGRVLLSKKQHGARSQLWRMTAEGMLQHEGSSPPRASPDKILVLDICGPAPQPAQYVGLMVRRPDKRRTCTQSWRFTEDGRLCCAHNNMCVQAKDGFFGLRSGSEVVLGPPQPVFYQKTEQGVPLEQAVVRQRLRPGSGCLTLKVTSDGPTRILKIVDLKEKKRVCCVSAEDDWIKILGMEKPQMDSVPTPVGQDKSEMQLTIELPKVGLSLVSQWPPEELIFITLSGIRLSALLTPSSEIYDISIQDIQVDNQQLDAQCPVVFFVTPSSRSSDPDEAAKPVLSITAERTPTKKTINADIFKYLIVRIKSISMIIDERLALKLFLFTGLNQEEEIENTDESDFETQRILAEAASVHAKRYYFDSLKLIFTQVRLSVITSNKLTKRLLNMKRKLGWTLIRFEDAAIELEPFIKHHSFESGQLLWNSVLKHYKSEMKWQAGIILGSVDFLGNPLGFVNDVSEGVSGLLYEGNLSALVRNVAHGLSNSTAKFTETLGDGLGRVSLDESYEETRQKIRMVETGSSGDHLIAGLKGLGFGLLGGVTSIFKQSYDGAAADGLPGFISGFGKGIVGTVTKPVVGVLDLASETASAVRDSSKSSSKRIPNRKRLPRCVISPVGFLPVYNSKQSLGQQFLYTINGKNFKELFMAYEVLRSGSEDLRIVISSRSVRGFTCSQSSSDPTVVFEKNINDLYHCNMVIQAGSNSELRHYIELIMRIETTAPGVPGHEPVQRPKVRCDSEAIASWVSQQVNYAKAQFIERQHTLYYSGDLQED